MNLDKIVEGEEDDDELMDDEEEVQEVNGEAMGKKENAEVFNEMIEGEV